MNFSLSNMFCTNTYIHTHTHINYTYYLIYLKYFIILCNTLYYFCSCSSGQLNDSRIEKGDPLKGDTSKTDINNDTEGTWLISVFFIVFVS